MSLSSATNRNDYTGNGSVDTYSYTFKVFSEDHLVVTVRDTSDVETTLTKTTHYTVSGVGSTNGGSIALVAGAFDWLNVGNDLKSGYKLTIRRVVPLTQETDIRNAGTFYPATHEDQFDKQVMISQQQQDDLDRSVTLPETVPSSEFDPTLPSDILDSANKVPMMNATGDGFTDAANWPTANEISAAQGYALAADASADAAAISAAAASGHEDLAQDWAMKTNGIVDSTDYAAKAWAIGGTGVTTTASRGAAKEWATKTDAPVDTSEFSAKEYAQGTQASTGGSAKNWAQQTGADVTGASANDRSAKSWAQDSLTGATLGGSAKDWAQYTGGTVDGTEYSAKKYAQDAAAALASAFFRDVVYITSASSPYTVTQSDNGKLFDIDSSGGAIAINLPEISGLSLPFNLAMKLTVAGNTVTIGRGGTDTIDGGTSKTLVASGTGLQISADTDGSPDNWTSLDFGTIADGSVTTPKLANGAVELAKLAAAVAAALNPAGTVIAYAGTSAPTGYLACDGSQVSRTTYAALFAAIGTAHGNGDGSTTFHLPDYRGRFLRGWANGSANDPDRASRTAMNTGGATGDNVGSVQGHAFQTHTHTQNSHTHPYNMGVGATGGSLPAYAVAANTANNSNGTTSATTATNQNAGATGATAQASTNETRPVNAYVMYCIKT